MTSYYIRAEETDVNFASDLNKKLVPRVLLPHLYTCLHQLSFRLYLRGWTVQEELLNRQRLSRRCLKFLNAACSAFFRISFPVLRISQRVWNYGIFRTCQRSNCHLLRYLTVGGIGKSSVYIHIDNISIEYPRIRVIPFRQVWREDYGVFSGANARFNVCLNATRKRRGSS